jgi:hypothetical protein
MLGELNCDCGDSAYFLLHLLLQKLDKKIAFMGLSSTGTAAAWMRFQNLLNG